MAQVDTKPAVPATLERERIPLGRTVVNGVRLAWQASPATWLVLIVASVFTALTSPAVLWLGRHLINLIAERSVGAGPRVLPTVLALGGLASFQRIASIVLTYKQQAFTYQVQRVAEQRLLEKSVRLDVGLLDDPTFHDRMQRASREAGYRPFNLTYSLLNFTGYGVQLLGLVGLLTLLHPLLLVLVGGSVLVSAATQRTVAKRSYAVSYADTPEERESMYLRGLMVDDRALKEIHAFGLQQHFLDRYHALRLKLIANIAEVFRAGTRATMLSGCVGALMLAAAYWFVAAEGAAGRLTAGDLFLVMSSFTLVTSLVGSISAGVVSVQEHATFLRDYFEFLETPPLIVVRPDPVAIPTKLERGIELQDVWFTYPTGTEPALAGVSLRVAPGEMLALVGENGAGKTTIVKLMLRFYDAGRGNVRIGGVDVRDTDPAGLRSRFGVLFQDFQQYYLSVHENVTLGRIERRHTDDQVVEALSAARALDVVKRLPRGLDSKVGRIFEGGHDLSGGEWQRLALARLMYRDADVWILDEPTSSLDPEAEAAIFAELKASLRDRIGIVISHRFSTVRIADRIAVVRDGRITELGTHAELVALGGRYAELFELQAAGYR